MTRMFTRPPYLGRTLCWLAIIACCGLLSGCSLGAQAPDFLILNSYFPSWLIGAIAATPVAVAVRYGLIRLGVDDYLPLRFFVYLGLWLILALAFAYLYSPR